MSALFVTGLMRSGTSLAAEVLNRLGWHASPLIAAPAPPAWRSDWEDMELTRKLMFGLEVDWRVYLEERMDASASLGMDGNFAVKSPYLALRYKEIQAVAPDARWIVCERRNVEVERSLAHYPQLSRLDQAKIDRALASIAPTFTVSYEQMIAHPQLSVAHLAGALGCSSREDIAAAAKLVGKPTEYELCPL